MRTSEKSKCKCTTKVGRLLPSPPSAPFLPSTNTRLSAHTPVSASTVVTRQHASTTTTQPTCLPSPCLTVAAHTAPKSLPSRHTIPKLKYLHTSWSAHHVTLTRETIPTSYTKICIREMHVHLMHVGGTTNSIASGSCSRVMIYPPSNGQRQRKAVGFAHHQFGVPRSLKG